MLFKAFLVSVLHCFIYIASCLFHCCTACQRLKGYSWLNGLASYPRDLCLGTEVPRHSAGGVGSSVRTIHRFRLWDTEIKVVGTRVCHAITVTRFMQPMPILTLSRLKSMLGKNLFRPTHMYINTNFLQRRGYMASWPLPHKMLNSASIPQTFSVTCRIALSASRRSYKT